MNEFDDLFDEMMRNNERLFLKSIELKSMFKKIGVRRYSPNINCEYYINQEIEIYKSKIVQDMMIYVNLQ